MKKVEKLIQEISNLVEHDFDNFQSYLSVEDWPIGEVRSVQGSQNTKVYEGVHDMTFFIMIPAGDYFPVHWHDCIESCEILGGQLHDKFTGRIWDVGETALFSAGQKHQPGNKGKGPLYMIVRFQK